MTRLEELTPGARVHGLLADRPVAVVQVEWHGTSALTVVYRDDGGKVEDTLLYRDAESRLQLESAGRAWSLDGDGALFRLVSEARRISMAYLFDPFLAVQTSNLDPLPHQIEAVYSKMLDRQPLRFLLADDPGAGKTIMAGLLIKELMIRGDVERCLVVAPGSLVEQWQDELAQKFGLSFDILTLGAVEASQTGNPLAERHNVIARLHQLSRNADLQAKLDATEWDLVVVDEAHKMSAHYYGNELKETKLYRLGKQLGMRSRHLLLMTATPHSGKEESFQLFMALLDSDRFEGKPRDGLRKVDASDMMRRLVKEKLLRFDGRPLFPERRAYSPSYPLSEPELELYGRVTEYVQEEMNRAEQLKHKGQGRRGNTVGFALTTLQRRLASSPEAIYRSLERRRKRLEQRLADERIGRRADEVRRTGAIPALVEELDEDFDPDDLTNEESEELEEELVDQASAAETIAELEYEIERLRLLESAARAVRNSGKDRKWDELSRIVQDAPEMFDAHGNRRKMIVFTEHKDTLAYLVERLRGLLGRPEAVVAIHGGVRREERRKIQEAFILDREVVILVATDAAGEGVNLQRANLVVNYDLPWNPNRIEQRFGRVHRIGQKEVCHLWNLVAKDTREGQVFERLFEKLAEMRTALGDQVFDVLGQAFEGRPLRELLIDAIRYGEQPEVKDRLNQVVDETVGARLKGVVRERALTTDVMSMSDVEQIRDEMERADARRLQPQFVRAFFLEAFRRLGGRASQRETGRWECTHVPAALRSRDRQVGTGAPLLRAYERVTFEKELVNVAGAPTAALLAPGHPLLDATIDVTIEQHASLLKQGTTLIDETDSGETPRVLVYLEHAIVDGRVDAHGNRRVVSKRFEFVEIDQRGEARLAGWAPHLDYRPISADEQTALADLRESGWVREDLERESRSYAIEHAVPRHKEEVERRTLDRVNRTEAAVRSRLLSEIAYWDHRANQLKEQELAGKKPRLNSGRARQRATDLEERLERRLGELAQERQIAALPPVVVGGALVVPQGLLDSLAGGHDGKPPIHARDTERVDKAAIAAVLAAEERLGRDAHEMPHNNPGYDIESKPPNGDLLFIEVKGRIEGAPTVTVKKTQILVGRNKPDQFILALVNVPSDGGDCQVRYLRQPFAEIGEPHFASVAETFDWKKLWNSGQDPS